MEVTYQGSNWKGEPIRENQSLVQFVYEEVLFKDNYRCDREKIILENQPKAVAEALGRLVEVLIKKNVLNLEDLKYITQCDWGCKADSLALKMEE